MTDRLTITQKVGRSWQYTLEGTMAIITYSGLAIAYFLIGAKIFFYERGFCYTHEKLPFALFDRPETLCDKCLD